jgi:energy-coupling factor transport system permease protein
LSGHKKRGVSVIGNIKPQKNQFLTAMDPGIKAGLVIILVLMLFWSKMPLSFAVILLYILLITVLSGLSFRILLRILLYLSVALIVPYLFGLIFSICGVLFEPGGFSFGSINFPAIALKFGRLILLGYIGSIYMYTTPFGRIVGMLNRLFTPVKRCGAPVRDYLKILICIRTELPNAIKRSRDTLARWRDPAGTVKRRSLKSKIEGMANVIVSQILQSFQEIERIQRLIDETDCADLDAFRFKVSKSDIIAIISLILLGGAVLWMEL